MSKIATCNYKLITESTTTLTSLQACVHGVNNGRRIPGIMRDVFVGVVVQSLSHEGQCYMVWPVHVYHAGQWECVGGGGEGGEREGGREVRKELTVSSKIGPMGIHLG